MESMKFMKRYICHKIQQNHVYVALDNILSKAHVMSYKVIWMHKKYDKTSLSVQSM